MKNLGLHKVHEMPRLVFLKQNIPHAFRREIYYSMTIKYDIKVQIRSRDHRKNLQKRIFYETTF